MVSGQLLISFKFHGGCHHTPIIHLCTDSKACGHVVSLSSSDKSTCHFTKIDNQKKKVAHKGDGAVNKEKVIVLEEKFKLNVHGVIEQRADFRTVDTAVM